MKKKTLVGIITGVVIVPVVACAILLNFKSVGIGDSSAFRDETEIEGETTSYMDDEALALASSSQSDTSLYNMAQNAAILVNQQRAAIGLKPLAWSSSLTNAANVRSSEISTLFSHTRPDGRSWYTVNSRIQGGENLAYGFSSPESALQAWMQSPTHKENILWPTFKSIGISIYVSDNGTYYWAQEFGY